MDSLVTYNSKLVSFGVGIVSLPDIPRNTYFMLDVALPQNLDGPARYQCGITLSGLEFYDTDGNLIPVEYVVGSTGNYSGYGSENLLDSDDTTYWYESSTSTRSQLPERISPLL